MQQQPVKEGVRSPDEIRHWVTKRLLRFSYALLMVWTIASCATRREVIYFQDHKHVLDSTFHVEYIKIKPMDRLRIIVAGPDEEAIAPFRATGQGGGGGGAQRMGMLYTVDLEGRVVLPYLGEVQVAGQTRLQVIETVRTALRRYVNEPIVDVQLENFRVTVLGATGAQVINYAEHDRPTVLEAIAASGDLNIMAKRSDILLIREVDGRRQSYRLDIRDANLLNSPAYYLAQNDIIYIEPNSTGIQGYRRAWYLTVGMTFVTAGLTLYTLFTR